MSETIQNQRQYKQSSIALWSKRILDCKNSGLTVSKWCEENNISIKSYWRWHKILKDQYMEYCHQNETHSEPEFYEVQQPEDPPVVRDAVVSFRRSNLSADVYTDDPELLSIICKALVSC